MSRKTEPDSSYLTRKEKVVLQWLAHGKRCIDIAQLMDASENSISLHLFRIKNKLGTETQAGAVAIGIRKGLIS